MEIATVGTRICSNRDLFDLPVSTLLVGDNGESYRIGSHFGEKQVIVNSTSGTPTGTNKASETDMDVHYGVRIGDYGLTIVWMPHPRSIKNS